MQYLFIRIFITAICSYYIADHDAAAAAAAAAAADDDNNGSVDGDNVQFQMLS